MKRAALLLFLFCIACSPYGRVKNLDSRGSAVIAFGDSLTAGYGAGEGEDWPSRVAASTSLAIVNAGVNGDTTDSALARLDDDVLARDPRIVIVGLGGNDFLRGAPLSSTETNLRGIVRKIHGRGAMVVLLGFRFPTLNADYEAMYERVAEEEGCLLVKGTLKGILTDPKLKSDQIHPNAAGYALMAERIAGPLQKLVARADA
ncbi:MAG TPA: arylesterase [Thermoanaerobaculia bacterium]|nr:arylesterase [Thermoanaerobaculia bacterium]